MFGLVAGAWVDRLRRRPVLIWADLGRAVLLGSVPVAFALGVLSFPQLLVVSGLAAILTTFFDAADNAYLPTIVERERLVDANSALAASGSAAEFMAFGISGFLVQVLTAPIAIAVDAVTYLASALLLGTRSATRSRPPPNPRTASRSLAEIRVGLSLVRHDPVLRAFVGRPDVARGAVGHLRRDLVPVRARRARLEPSGARCRRRGRWRVVVHRRGRRDARDRSLGCRAGGHRGDAPGGARERVHPARAGRACRFVAVACLVMQQLVADSAVTVYDITEVSVRQTLVDDRALGRVASTFKVAAMLAQLVATLVAGSWPRPSACARRRGWHRSGDWWAPRSCGSHRSAT